MAYNKEMLRDSIIEEYIRLREPIGSETLKASLKLKVSSATIRNYFKVLMQEGILIQPHISSGRIPTDRAMKIYWRSKLSYLNFKIKSLQSLQEASRLFGIFVLLRKKSSLKLQSIKKLEEKILVLDFGSDLIAIPFSSAFEKFLNDLIGLGLEEIKNIAHQVMAIDLFNRLNTINHHQINYFGLNFLSPLVDDKRYNSLFFEIIEGKILDTIHQGIFFDPLLPEGFMGTFQETTLTEISHNEDQAVQMLCIAPLMSDYQSFCDKVAA